MAKISIISYGVKPADQFLANPMNPRTHPMNQRAALGDSLERVGFIAPVLESAHSGYLLDGHERVWQALRENNADVPYVIVDVAPEDEAYVLATFDPIGSLAQIDPIKMGELLQEVATENEAV